MFRCVVRFEWICEDLWWVNNSKHTYELYIVFKRESSPETDFSSVFLIFQADKKWTIAKKRYLLAIMQSSWQFSRFVFISIFMENSWLFSSPFIKSTQSINKMFRIDLSDRYHDYENASKQAVARRQFGMRGQRVTYDFINQKRLISVAQETKNWKHNLKFTLGNSTSTRTRSVWSQEVICVALRYVLWSWVSSIVMNIFCWSDSSYVLSESIK